jgi:uncharacterized membrane protein
VTSSHTRIDAFDWLRGLAVVVMIQTHARSLLLPQLRETETYRQLDRIDGLVAPAFLLTAGFALALTHQRGARWQHSLRRIGKVLAVATLVNALWFDLLVEPLKLLRLDILHCIGLSLLAALGVLTMSQRKMLLAASAFAGLSCVVLLGSPLLEHVTPALALFVNEQSGALFPLFPWSAYVFLGALFGVLTASKPQRLPVFLTAGIAFAASLYAAKEPLRALYPAHNFLRTNPFMAAERLVLVLTLLLALHHFQTFFERRRAFQFLRRFGSNSLSAYFFHEMLLFHRRLGPLCFENNFYQRANWWQYALLVVALVVMTVLLCDGFEWAKKRLWVGSEGRPYSV